MIKRQKGVQYWCRSLPPENEDRNDRKSCTAVDNMVFCTIVSTLLLICTMFIIFILIPSKNMASFIQLKPPCESSTTLKRTLYRDRLEKALAGAATEDKTVIITVINEAYVEGDNKPMLDLFLDSFWLGDGTRGLLDHLLVVTVDRNSYRRCRFLRLHCYQLETDGGEFVGEKKFMSEDFIKFMWRRTLFLGDVLRRGYSFIFTDTDILWLRNPFPILRSNATVDLQISTDKFNGDDEDWSHQANHINTGFYMIKSNEKTIALFDAWYAARKYNIGWKEQDVLIKLIMNNGLFRQLGLKVKFLDTLYFSGFCQNSKDVNRVVTVHGNCCQSISAKLLDLTTVIHDWKRFRNSSSNGRIRATFRWSDHVNCWNSWKI